MKRVGSRGIVSVHTGGNWWKLMIEAVPNGTATTKGSMKANRNCFAHLHGQEHQSTVLMEPQRKKEKTNGSWEMPGNAVYGKVKPSLQKPAFLPQNKVSQRRNYNVS